MLDFPDKETPTPKHLRAINQPTPVHWRQTWRELTPIRSKLGKYFQLNFTKPPARV
jgi:hypothetical protein